MGFVEAALLGLADPRSRTPPLPDPDDWFAEPAAPPRTSKPQAESAGTSRARAIKFPEGGGEPCAEAMKRTAAASSPAARSAPAS